MKKRVVVSIAIILALIIAAFTVYILLKANSNTSVNTNTSVNQSLTIINPVNQTENVVNTTPVNSNPETYIIDIDDRMYEQNLITIKIGDRVTWSNKDSTGHTVTSDEGIELSSSKLSEGDTYSHTFDKAGTYPYHCIYHSSMHGTVIVQ